MDLLLTEEIASCCWWAGFLQAARLRIPYGTVAHMLSQYVFYFEQLADQKRQIINLFMIFVIGLCI
jgi:hypothetical protein